MALPLAAQKHTIKGFVKDAETGKGLPGASVYPVTNPSSGTTTNNEGHYKLTLEEGSYTIVTEFVGYKTDTFHVRLTSDRQHTFQLHSEVVTTDEVEVTGKREKDIVDNAETGVIDLETEDVEKVPALMGETDIMRTLRLMPGVTSLGEGSTGIFVRGGSPDQNLTLLDEATIYNTGHLFGFFSVFNAPAIDKTSLYKGVIPSRYGGRLSSVLDFTMNRGNKKEWKGRGSIGLISSKIQVEGPIKKDKTSLMISGRRTYVDVLSRPFTDGGLPYYFFDLNGKIHHRFSDKDQLYISSYYGRDQLGITFMDGRVQTDIRWGNFTSTVGWKHIFNEDFYMNLSAARNNFMFSGEATFDNFTSRVNSDITEYHLKPEFHSFAGDHHIQWGGKFSYRRFNPRSSETRTTDNNLNFQSEANPVKYARQADLFLMDEFPLGDRWKINAGIRGSLFQHIGPYNYVEEKENTIDTTKYSSWESVKDYWGISPRISARYRLNDRSAVKAGFMHNYQYIHRVSLSGNSLPFDLWVPGSKLARPQTGNQYTVGYYRYIRDKMFKASLETYFRSMTNQAEYRQYYVPTLTTELERELVFGKGRSFGAELMVRKEKGDWQGWFSYTFSRTTRTFDQINNGNRFPARWDRPHDISITSSYQLNEKWRLGGTFVFRSGQPITLQQDRYFIEGNITNYYGPRNGFRMPPYHRLDLSATYSEKDEADDFHSEWTFSVYNVYNRKNPFFIYADTKGSLDQNNLEVVAKKIYLFPVMPSVSWKFAF